LREKLTTRKDYLSALNDFKAKYEKALEFDADMAQDYDFPKLHFSRQQTGLFIIQKQMDFTSPCPQIKYCHAMTQ
jgi:hypothetical protein